MILPQTLTISQVIERSGLDEDDLFENGVNGSLEFVVVVPELGACRLSKVAMSHFLAGADTYNGDKLPELYSAEPSGPWTVCKSRLRILASSWRDWEAHFQSIGNLSDDATNESAKAALLLAARRTSVAFDRLRVQSNDFRGGRIADNDLLSLGEAAAMASRHAGLEVTVGDILRTAARGEILLHAIVHQRGRVFKAGGGSCINAGHPTDENAIPAGGIPTLPLVACEHLANTGRARWRTFDAIKIDESGEPWRYVKYQLEPYESDFETIADDCRITGYDLHALADAFCDENAMQESPADAVPLRSEASGEPVGAGVPLVERPPSVSHSTKRPRRDHLDPAIDHAQSQCRDPNDAAEVWAMLQSAARRGDGPFLGITEDGLQYLRSGDPAYLTRDALTKRVARRAVAKRY